MNKLIQFLFILYPVTAAILFVAARPPTEKKPISIPAAIYTNAAFLKPVPPEVPKNGSYPYLRLGSPKNWNSKNARYSSGINTKRQMTQNHSRHKN
jgi:hypothetical protein